MYAGQMIQDLITILALPEGKMIGGEYKGSVRQWKEMAEEVQVQKRKLALDSALRKIEALNG